ncbi:hypothetical protein TEA_016656 [Camellia sinensis var. sinensis]|uniref:Pectinesterase inhibitor domain-containing protein n=1 Tax=Camellia sinensis var. sinensis TaxID=542762 RepID=A0A4S4D0A1_CAMSN|nr:hypothetical protein TEA_016656 [Camellia sinensis var. sinensis]
MEQALEELNQMKWLGPKCHDKREKAAWIDCLKLYQSTVLQLNQTLDKSTKHTDFDAQTWLSAALTFLDTCQNGFIELNVTKNIFPLMSNNVALMISNSLAVNNSTTEQQDYREGFPRWVSSGDRRLLWSELPIPDLVVAQDGSGDFCTIKEALDALMNMSHSGRFVIYVERGVYNECIEIELDMPNIMLVGDGWKNTIITGNRSHVGGFSTFDSATVSITGDGFIAQGITFHNTAGPQNGQAVALISLDFIFGNAAVVFQNCFIHGRTPINGNQIVITAQSRSDPNQNTGISFHRCRVAPAEDPKQLLRPFVAYLERPWRDYARVVYLRTYLDWFVPPEGWSQWGNQTDNLETLYYGEYKNYGPGSSTKSRVKWSGFHDMRNKTVAQNFSVAKLIGGDSWLPQAGIPFILDL